jgi:hypothetical protein
MTIFVNSSQSSLKTMFKKKSNWLILDAQEAEIRRIAVQSQPGK